MVRALALVVWAFFAGSEAVLAQSRIDVLIPTTLEAWKNKMFQGTTQYLPVIVDGVPAIKAVAQASASGLFREMDIDLRKTPILNWRWHSEDSFHDNDERRKSGDDYVARIYVVRSGGALFWRTKALNYVWSSHQPTGARWPSAFTSNAQMIAVSSGPAQKGDWIMLKRNVRDDFRNAFGQDDINTIDAVAIMTDADNTGQSVEAYYGEIYFSAQ